MPNERRGTGRERADRTTLPLRSILVVQSWLSDPGRRCYVSHARTHARIAHARTVSSSPTLLHPVCAIGLSFRPCSSCLLSASTSLRPPSLPRCAYSQDRDGSSSARWHGTSNNGSRWVYGGEPHAPRRGYTRWARVSRCGRVATALARPSRSAESSPTMTMIPSSAATAGAVAAHRPPQMSMGEAATTDEGTGGTSASHLP